MAIINFILAFAGVCGVVLFIETLLNIAEGYSDPDSWPDPPDYYD